jgi:hypothetical protein
VERKEALPHPHPAAGEEGGRWRPKGQRLAGGRRRGGAEESGPGRAEGGARGGSSGWRVRPEQRRPTLGARRVELDAGRSGWRARQRSLAGRVAVASWESGGGVGGLVKIYPDGIWEGGGGRARRGRGSGLGFPPISLYIIFSLDSGMNNKKGRGFSAKHDRTNL